MRILRALLALLLSMGVAHAATKGGVAPKQKQEQFSCYYIQENMEWPLFGVQVLVNPKAAIAWKIGGMLFEEVVKDKQFKQGFWFVLDPIGGSIEHWMRNTQTREEWEAACWLNVLWKGANAVNDLRGLRGGGGGGFTAKHKHHRHHHHWHHHHHWRKHHASHGKGLRTPHRLPHKGGLRVHKYHH